MKVRGSALAARVHWAKQRGVADYARWLNSVSQKTRNEIERGFDPGAWYAFETFEEVNTTLDELFGTGDLALCEELGRYACDLNLKRFYRFLFRVGNVHFILRRAAAAWQVSYDAGEMQLLDEQEKACTLQMVGVPQPSRAHCASVRGWVLEAGKISGVDMKVEGETCRAGGDAECTLTLSW